MGNEFDYISENLRRIRADIGEACAAAGRAPESVRLMAVTKTVAPEAVNHAIAEGVDLLGENRVQEFLSKKDSYDSSAEVHMIGHLQTNKVKYIINDVSMIQSVDSEKLLGEISHLAVKNGRIMDILCEVNIGGEDSKSGVHPDDLHGLLMKASQTEGIRLRGLMTIPPPSESDIFLGRMSELFERFSGEFSMDTLSMGMTHDYADAIRFGSTLVRVGTGMFGARSYK
jgi:pyridoxal phosphate enzyme (YggS family)